MGKNLTAEAMKRVDLKPRPIRSLVEDGRVQSYMRPQRIYAGIELESGRLVAKDSSIYSSGEFEEILKGHEGLFPKPAKIRYANFVSSLFQDFALDIINLKNETFEKNEMERTREKYADLVTLAMADENLANTLKNFTRQYKSVMGRYEIK